jgi:4,5-dihydroxyphthalate decarboxylase
MPNQKPYHAEAGRLVLETALGKYPSTQALHAGRVPSDLIALDMADVPVIIRAFASMVREQRYAVSEMALATFLQAKAYDKPLVLLPIVIAARFQQHAFLCRADSDIRGPQDVGRRVGVRAYSQTTGMWLRGILADEHGVRPEEVRWRTFEDAHVAEYRDPPWAERADPGQDLVTMLRNRELDAIIVGNDVPDDSAFRTVFPDPNASAEVFWRKHRFVPVNHMVTVRRDIATEHPEALRELMRLFRESNAISAAQTSAGRDPLVSGRGSLDPAMRLALRYTGEQGLLPRMMEVEDVWEGLPVGLEEALT